MAGRVRLEEAETSVIAFGSNSCVRGCKRRGGTHRVEGGRQQGCRSTFASIVVAGETEGVQRRQAAQLSHLGVRPVHHLTIPGTARWECLQHQTIARCYTFKLPQEAVAHCTGFDVRHTDAHSDCFDAGIQHHSAALHKRRACFKFSTNFDFVRSPQLRHGTSSFSDDRCAQATFKTTNSWEKDVVTHIQPQQ